MICILDLNSVLVLHLQFSFEIRFIINHLFIKNCVNWIKVFLYCFATYSNPIYITLFLYYTMYTISHY